jgi:hypothetical protein
LHFIVVDLGSGCDGKHYKYTREQLKAGLLSSGFELMDDKNPCS